MYLICKFAREFKSSGHIFVIFSQLTRIFIKILAKLGEKWYNVIYIALNLFQ